MTSNSPGTCCLCGTVESKAAMARHLRACAPGHDRPRGDAEALFHLRVEGAAAPIHWLDLEVKGRARLADLDKFLRKIWLECCGHLSAFRIGRWTYTIPMDDPFGSENERSLNVRLSEALESSPSRFSYEYDFGSTTELNLRIGGERRGAIGRQLVRLLSRNNAPVWPCHVCQQPATLVCAYCTYESESFVCKKHAQAHECEEEAFLPVVNSPRMGVCGYTGEALWE